MKIVYLPIETKSREFDSRCLLALTLIENGFAVVIGSDKNVISNTHQPGIILLNSSAGFELQKIKNLKQKSVIVCTLDEEGFVHIDNEQEHKLRYSQDTLDALDAVFFNGDAECNLMCSEYKIAAEKVEVTGNPRFDFYKLDFRNYFVDDANKLQSKYGQYILIPSRFGEVNLAVKDDYITFLKKLNFITNQDQLEVFTGSLAHSKLIYDAFIELLPKLAQSFKDYTIIVRPHPSESSLGWLKSAHGLDNVVVVQKGAIGPWLLGASAIIHNGCTTGLEAFLMEKVVISYMPYKSEEFDLALPNNVSIQCTTADLIIDNLKNILKLSEKKLNWYDGDETVSNRTVYASKHLKNAVTNEYAYIKISSSLNRLAKNLPDIELGIFKRNLGLEFKKFILKFRNRLAYLLSNFGLSFPRLFGDGYSFRKNPGISSIEIKKNLEKIASSTKSSTKNIKIRKIDQDTFLIYNSKIL